MAAQDHKAKGNELYQAEKYEAALEEYTKAIDLSPQDGVLYSNRSACYAALEQWNECLADATTCLKLKPDWFKSYYRRALALHMMRRNVEARGLCNAGLALEPENKELKGLKLKCNEPICREFANASAIDFRMDRPPSEDFKLVLKGKSPVKGAQLNGLAFPQTLRTMLHTAVMCQYPKIVKELISRGADIAIEDRMGLSPVHMSALIQHEGVMSVISEHWDSTQNVSTTHNATPQDILDATSFTLQRPEVKVKVLDREGKAAALNAIEFMQKMGAFYQRTCQLSDEYFRCMYSSILDDEGTELMQDPRKNELTAKFKASEEEKDLGIAWVNDEIGYGVFALKPFKEGDYVCSFCGQLLSNFEIKEQSRNPYVITIMPLDKLPFKTDASLYRSMGAYINHSDSPNTTPEHIVAKCAPMVVFIANRNIEPGEQISFDYRGRLHALFCEQNLPSFKPLESLPPTQLSALQKV